MIGLDDMFGDIEHPTIAGLSQSHPKEYPSVLKEGCRLAGNDGPSRPVKGVAFAGAVE